MKRRVLLMAVAAVMAVTFMPLTASAAPAKKATTYGRVIKADGYVYCTAGYGLYKVNEKKGTVKRLDKGVLADSEFKNMKKNGKYLYVKVKGPYGEGWDQLWRVNVNSGGWLQLLGPENGSLIGSYAISGGKIYYGNGFHDKGKYHKMNLNGKKKTDTSTKAIMYTKYSNVKGYSVYSSTRGNVEFWWLKTPGNKRILLAKYYTSEYVKNVICKGKLPAGGAPRGFRVR